MAEDQNQEKESDIQAPNEDASPKESASSNVKASPPKKTGNMFSKMFGLGKKPNAQGDKAVGDPKSAQAIKNCSCGARKEHPSVKSLSAKKISSFKKLDGTLMERISRQWISQDWYLFIPR